MARRSGINRLLSVREKTILMLSASGMSDPEISKALKVSQGTLRFGRFAALRKLREN